MPLTRVTLGTLLFDGAVGRGRAGRDRMGWSGGQGQGQGAAKFDSEELLRTIKQQMDGLKEELEGKTIAAVKEELEALKQKQQRTDEAIGQIGVTFEDELMAEWLPNLKQTSTHTATSIHPRTAMRTAIHLGTHAMARMV